MKIKTLILFICFIEAVNLYPAVWQWSAEVKSDISSETNACPQAFLWIPENCMQVRGIVIGMHNMQEEGIMEHPVFRKAMTKLGFAEIWITPGLDPLFDVKDGTHKALFGTLKSLADISGYSEIESAPIIAIGHSAYASYPWNFGAWYPERTLAMLSIHGDAPQTHLTGCGRPNLNWGNRDIAGVPGLMVMGEDEWWEDRLFSALDYRKNKPEIPVSLLADAGHGHFDHSDMLIEYLTLFIEKSAKYRLPKEMSLDKPVKLITIDATQGWLADRWHADQTLPEASPNSYSKYEGDKSTAFWYFDKKTALATEKYYAQARGKKTQYVGYEQNGKLLDYNEKAHSKFNVQFNPGSDGLTFHIKAVFTDSLREKLSDKHARKGKPRVDRINGPIEKVNDTTFTVRFYRMGLDNSKRTGDIWLIARHDGDKTYKSAVQQLNIRIPYRNGEGEEQKINFPELENVPRKTAAVQLKATSGSGLPVYFYVKEGPAEIIGNEIIFTKIPPRAEFPVKVTIVAWQYGRNTKPKIRTAEAVERSFYIQQ